MKRRGMLFSWDALLTVALVVILIAAVVTSANIQNTASTATVERQYQTANEILLTLQNTPLNQLVPQSVINNWIASGVLNTSLVSPDSTLGDIVATYWAMDPLVPANLTKDAQIIVSYVMKKIAPDYDYRLMINNPSNTIAQKGDPATAKDIFSGQLFISGYAKGSYPNGYIARAYVLDVSTKRAQLNILPRVLTVEGYCKVYSMGYALVVFRTYTWYVPMIWNVLQFLANFTAPVHPNSIITTGPQATYTGSITDGRLVYDIEYVGATGWTPQTYNESLVGHNIYISFYDEVYGYTYSRIHFYVEIPDKNHIINFDGVLTDTYTTSTGETVRVYRIAHMQIYQPPYYIYFNATDVPESDFSGIYAKAYFRNNQLKKIELTSDYHSPYGECVETGGNSLELAFNDTIPTDAKDISSYLQIYPRTTGLSQLKYAELNGVKIYPFYPTNDISQDVSSYVKPGQNTLKILFQGYTTVSYDTEMGTGSGSYWSISYQTDQLSPGNPYKKYFMYAESAHAGLVYFQPMLIQGQLENATIYLDEEGAKNVTVYLLSPTWAVKVYTNEFPDRGRHQIQINTTQIENALKNAGIPLSDLNNYVVTVLVLLDVKTINGYPYYGGTPDYQPDAKNARILYPDSYVEIRTVGGILNNPYYIPRDELVKAQGLPSYNLNYWYGGHYGLKFVFDQPQFAIPGYFEAMIGISYNPSASQSQLGTTTYKLNGKTLFKTPSWAYLFYFATSLYYLEQEGSYTPTEKNTITITSNSKNYGFRPGASLGIYHYYLYGYAPYGKVFPKLSQDNACYYDLTYYYKTGTQVKSGQITVKACDDKTKTLTLTAGQLKPDEYAIDDAIVRLFYNLGASKTSSYLPGTSQNPILVKINNVEIIGVGVSGVSTSLKQIHLILQLWRG